MPRTRDADAAEMSILAIYATYVPSHYATRMPTLPHCSYADDDAISSAYG